MCPLLLLFFDEVVGVTTGLEVVFLVAIVYFHSNKSEGSKVPSICKTFIINAISK